MQEDRTTMRRELGLAGATMMGLGAIVGTGVFVSIGIAAGLAGPSVVLAIPLAALVATCNALSSAQLAANLPVSGGTYAYGYHYLRPWLGFAAGWMFLVAKTASAATAALGFAGYLLVLVGGSGQEMRMAIALAAIAGLTLVVLGGIRRSNRVNIAIVATTLAALGLFIAAGLPAAMEQGRVHLQFLWPHDIGTFLEATALMFVAYTGYGRIATLGEEVREPRRTIPAAIVLTLAISATLYIAVAVVGVGAVGASEMHAATQAQGAPLAIVARQFDVPYVDVAVSIGAMTAMLGVLLNLLLGLSRMLLAMGRTGDMPAIVTRLDATQSTPYVAVTMVAILISGLTLLGSIKIAWSLSAFTVLVYYAVTNLAALALPAEERLYPRSIAATGLAACLALAFWVERPIWLAGSGLLLIGLGWHLLVQKFRAFGTRV